MDGEVKRLLGKYAAKYEKAEFLEGDPSRFMHLVTGAANQEATAFVASGLSFGSRSQFLPRIQWLLDCAHGDMDRWIRTGAFERDMKHGDSRCFYRFFTYSDMHVVQEARRLGLLTSTCTSMSVARRLTAKLAEVFPDDPCRGDFALFGYGVDESSGAKTGDSA